MEPTEKSKIVFVGRAKVFSRVKGPINLFFLLGAWELDWEGQDGAVEA